MVPAGWFAAHPRLIAEAVVQLDHLTRAYRSEVAATPEFAPQALRQTAPAALIETASPMAASSHLVLATGDTLRLMCQRLKNVGMSMRELRNTVEAADKAAKRVGELLRVPLPPQPIKSLNLLVAIAAHVARMKPVRRSWWDAGRRKELQTVVAKCQKEARATQDTRALLAGRLSPKAFARDNAGLAAEACRFSSTWWWLPWNLPWRWFRIKSQVSKWYMGEPTTTRVRMEDLAQVDGYHRSLEYCDAVRTQYGPDLLSSDDGEPDWGGTLEAVEAVDRLAELIGKKLPPSLQEALGTEEGLDRSALANAAQVLGKQLGSLRQRLERLAGEYDLREVMDGDTPRIRVTAP